MKRSTFGKSHVEESQSHINTKNMGDHAYKMRGNYVKAFVILSILLASTFAYPSSYAQSGVMLNLAKRDYVVGESIIVSGIVQSPSSNVLVIIQVWNPNNEACGSQQINVSEDGSFIAIPIKLSGRVCSIPGTYTVTAFYGESEGTINFEVQAPVAVTQNANERLQTLLDILNKAKQSVDNKISDVQGKGIGIPNDVMEMYEEALVEVQETEDVVAEGDVNAAKEHATNAMTMLRKVFAALAQLEEAKTEVTASTDSTEESDDLKRAEKISELRQAIVRTIEFKNKLANIAATSNVSANFKDFDSVIEEAKLHVEQGNIDEAARALAKARKILSDIQESLTQRAKEYRQNKAREFVEKTVQRIDEMIANAMELKLPQEVIDALTNAKNKLLAAKNINEIINVANELKGEKADYVEHKGKNFERAVQNLEAKLREAKRVAEESNGNLEVFGKIDVMIKEAKELWAEGKTTDAVNMLEKAERALREVMGMKKGGMKDGAKNLAAELERLAKFAEDLKKEVGDNKEALSAIEKAQSLINSAKEILAGTASESDMQTAHNMFVQAKQLLDRAKQMVGGKVQPTPMPSVADDPETLKKMAQMLEDRAHRLMGVAEKQENKEAMNIIIEALEIVRKAKQVIEDENYDDAKSLLRQANELLNKAERMLREGSNTDQKPNIPPNDEQAKKAIMQEIQVLETVATDLKKKAGDNKEAHEYINDAVDDLNDAKQLVSEDHLDKAKSKVIDAKENLRKAQQIINNTNAGSEEEKEKSQSRSG